MKYIIDSREIAYKVDRTKFLGFTIDADQFEGGREESCIWELDNERIINLCRELKPATVRLGGSGIKHMYFCDEEGTALKEPFTFTIDREKCDALGEFCRKIGAGLMLSFSTFSRDVDNAIKLADYFISKRKDTVPFLEFDNEPDWGWGDIVGEYPDRVKNYYEKMSALFPEQQWIAGYGGRNLPEGICKTDSVDYMQLIEKCGDFIDVFSSHYYVLSSRRPYTSIELMLSERAVDIGHARIYELKKLLSMQKLDKKIAINEFNAYANKGKDGITNTMAAAVFLADFIGSLAKNGAYVNNIQCGFGKQHKEQAFWQYAMIDTRDNKIFVNPHYYSFYLWSRMMGSRFVPCYSSSAHPVCVHAAISDEEENQLGLIIVNKDMYQSQEVDLQMLSPIEQEFEVYTLCSDSPTGRSASINGVQAGEDGTMGDIRPRIRKSSFNDRIVIDVLPCSVTLLRVKMAKA